jgi:DNA-binding transcriptional LysR family regulator
MRTEQLEYVAAIARAGSFRRAADELHISQPALSSTVRNLERELGVDLLERGRAGAHLSDEGRELLPHIVTVIDAVDRLRRAADHQHRTSRVLRLGTVTAATASLLMATIAEFGLLHPETHLEVVGSREADIDSGLREGSLDLGLITALAGDDMPPGLETTHLLSGRPVVCMHSDSPLVALDAVGIDDLAGEQLIVMRPGYLMHRLVTRLLGDRLPDRSCSTDGAEMGKLMVAEGLGVTVLPDFSVWGDPLERHGLITFRPLAGDGIRVELGLRRRPSPTQPRAARDLHRLFLDQARSSPMLDRPAA